MHVQLVPGSKCLPTMLAGVAVHVGEVNILHVFVHVVPYNIDPLSPLKNNR